MYEKLIDFSRYIFIIYIGCFLLAGFLISLSEKNIISFNVSIGLKLQRVIVFLFHISCFLILCFDPTSQTFAPQTIPILTKSTMFIFLGNLVLIKFFSKSCPLVWNGIFFLMSIGITMLYRLNPALAQRQLNWFILGFLVSLFMPIVLNIFPKLTVFKHLYLILGLSLLVATLIYGNDSGGARNWITISGVTFQPSELVKILFLFYLSSCLAFEKNKITLKNLILPTISSIVFVLCLVLQRDLGGALIFLMTYLSMIYISTSSTFILASGLALSFFGAKFAYKYFDHIRVRVSIWLNPWEDISGKGYQIAQSLFAIGSFGLLGSGIKQGLPTSIPVVEKDFIFSAICEEFGIIFSIGVILIFIMVFFRCVKISLSCKNNFLCLLSSGITSLMCFQTFLILGGVTKLIPMTGVTLPFISYGGSSIIISFIQIGIIQWVSSKRFNQINT